MVRRHAARFAAVCALLGGSVAFGASPALAADDSVRVRAAGSFTAGGSPQGVSVEVRKRTDGCVLLRTALSLRLDGLRADQVDVQVNYGGRWFPVPVSGGGGGAATAATSPSNPRLCKGKGVTIRYRLAFAATAPDGRLAVGARPPAPPGRRWAGAATPRASGAPDRRPPRHRRRSRRPRRVR
ncbi:hypothetical protein [Micromonospora endolithica]|uniref:hypothetical protein n=1 Tax=Micromonospora endolithica TaxID=230091 RepID=UPI0011AB9572|nr:hypothetical protein JD76_04018 [Micromonospora endolithica]